uniref:toxin glutamine deamidase domain-containing protein n=1 Tax=Alloprevotella sp. TaxID=1872471 RepID=UPI004027EB02
MPSPTIIKGGDLIGKAEKQMKSVGRYHFGINYNAIEGHIITAEKTTDGMLYLYDAQSGNFINIDEFREAESFEILKVDKLLINKDILKKFQRLFSDISWCKAHKISSLSSKLRTIPLQSILTY